MQGGMGESSRPEHLLAALQSTPVKSGCEQLSVCRNPVTVTQISNLGWKTKHACAQKAKV